MMILCSQVYNHPTEFLLPCLCFYTLCYFCLEGRGSTCWRHQLILLSSSQRTRPLCTIPRMHTKPPRSQTHSKCNPRTHPVDLIRKTLLKIIVSKRCPSILGELLPARGIYYWETSVSQSTAYRLGVAYSTANRNSSVGENSLSWCLQCTPSPSG